MQWQSKPWRRWNHLLHLCSSCLSSTTTTSCVGSLHCTDWSLLDCRLLWHHDLLDYKFLYQLTGVLMIPFVYIYLALDCQLHVFMPFSLYLNAFCHYSIMCSLDYQCTLMLRIVCLVRGMCSSRRFIATVSFLCSLDCVGVTLCAVGYLCMYRNLLCK